MRVLISGSNGLIGSAVTSYLLDQGHTVTRLVRRTPQAGEVWWDPDGGRIDAAGLEGFDGVVHVASMPWPPHWTDEFKAKMRANRTGTCRLLAETLAECRHKPHVLVCASGMGYYPPSGDQVLDETCPGGDDFIATLQREGEAAAAPANAAGIRVVHLRIPAVIGGATLDSLVASLRCGMGRLGDGRQWSSWVGRDELASIVQYALTTGTLYGPVNAVSPNPVRNAEFTATLGRVVGRRPFLPVPAFLLRMLGGEMAETFALASRRLVPRRLLESGYRFRFSELEAALRHELHLPA